MRIIILLALLFAPAIASADKHHRYIGIHPIAKSHGGGLCYIEGPHVHLFEADKLQYRDHHGAAHFVGDPVAYGYDGPKHAYKGHHPIHVHVVVGEAEPHTEFCYLDGPHFHAFAQPDGPDFKVVDGTYFYVATPPKVYVEARPTFIGINAVYRPLVYVRPVVRVEAPVGWIGAVVVVPPAPVIVAPNVRVGVRVPVPSVRVDIGIGVGVGVGVKHKHHKHKRKRGWR